MAGTTALAIIAATVVVTILITRWRRERIERAYERHKFTRKLLAAIIGLLIAWTLLHSGDLLLMAIAVFFVASATVYWYIERPNVRIV